MLGNPDIIFVFGGTNDAWAGAPVGEYKYSDWTKEDCKYFRPALACLLDSLQKLYPKAKLYSILNSELREDINESMRVVCQHYNVQLIELHDIDKQNGHPSISGMKSISDQLLEAIKDDKNKINYACIYHHIIFHPGHSGHCNYCRQGGQSHRGLQHCLG